MYHVATACISETRCHAADAAIRGTPDCAPGLVSGHPYPIAGTRIPPLKPSAVQRQLGSSATFDASPPGEPVASSSSTAARYRHQREWTPTIFGSVFGTSMDRRCPPCRRQRREREGVEPSRSLDGGEVSGHRQQRARVRCAGLQGARGGRLAVHVAMDGARDSHLERGQLRLELIDT